MTKKTVLAALPSTATIEEARNRIDVLVAAGGGQCPCCDQPIKSYRRKMSYTIAAWLIGLYRAAPVGTPVDLNAVHVELERMGAKTAIRSGDYGKARYWGLIKSVRDPSAKGKKSGRSGRWVLTSLGEQFVTGVAYVPSYAIVKNKLLQGLEGDPISIKTALDTHFNYEELMSGVAVGPSEFMVP